MPVYIWHASLMRRQISFSRPGARSSPSNDAIQLWNTFICIHISVEINGRSARALSRALRTALTTDVGLVESNK